MSGLAKWQLPGKDRTLPYTGLKDGFDTPPDHPYGPGRDRAQEGGGRQAGLIQTGRRTLRRVQTLEERRRGNADALP
ncbi:MAG: hypothetical protein QOI89_3393 [Solirubrobacteraceae bacterium]|nr:hypothetical protein [Solirubrobacteraceae bacterium]